MKDDLERFRRIPLSRILNIRDIRREVSIQCVFPGHNDKSPSLRLYPNGGYHCFGCGLTGQNAIDFALHVNGVLNLKQVRPDEFKKAVDDLRDYL